MNENTFQEKFSELLNRIKALPPINGRGSSSWPRKPRTAAIGSSNP